MKDEISWFTHSAFSGLLAHPHHRCLTESYSAVAIGHKERHGIPTANIGSHEIGCRSFPP